MPDPYERHAPPVVKHLDFSQFHPLDHSVWECRGYPGGRRRHLQYRWDFQWRDRLRGMTLCLIGKHAWVHWWRGQTGESAGIVCRGCEKEKDA
jgi:hypothetical protein